MENNAETVYTIMLGYHPSLTTDTFSIRGEKNKVKLDFEGENENDFDESGNGNNNSVCQISSSKDIGPIDILAP
jgi:hypothetical protein